jgi:hypothetical protein
VNIYQYLDIALLGTLEFLAILYALNYGKIKFRWWHSYYSVIAIGIWAKTDLSDFYTAFLFQFFSAVFITLFVFFTPLITEKIDPLPREINVPLELAVANLHVIVTTAILVQTNGFQYASDYIVALTYLAMELLIMNAMIINAGHINHKNLRQYQLNREYGPLMGELIEDTRSKQHDVDNQLNAIRSVVMIAQDKPDDLKKLAAYIDDLENFYYYGTDLMKLHNHVVAGFLYSKKKYALEHNTGFDIKIDNYELKTRLKDYELIDVLSILVDNAFETDIIPNDVKIYLGTWNFKTIIQVANKHPKMSASEFDKLFIKGHSSKDNSVRGIGLYKLMKILHRNKAAINVYNKRLTNNYIVFEVTLP